MSANSNAIVIGSGIAGLSIAQGVRGLKVAICDRGEIRFRHHWADNGPSGTDM